MANLASKGKAEIPDYDFSKAKVIVSIDADFLEVAGYRQLNIQKDISKPERFQRKIRT